MKGFLSTVAAGAALAISSPACAATLVISGTSVGSLNNAVGVNSDNTGWGRLSANKGYPGSEVQAVDSNSYFSTLLSAAPGQNLGLDHLSFEVTKRGDSAPISYFVRSSADDFTANLFAGTVSDSTSDYIPQSIDLGTTFVNSAEATFRFYGYARTGEVALYFQNIQFTGPDAVSAAPEPGTWAMMILGFGFVGFALRRRQKVTTRVSFAA